ncbi:hypothetical protein Q9L58_005848 [Maublancomyces gigas]|uniref:RING-type domain-containing protein n=1 Tax=Discina gigas TaxID=1032678 RepID=A0ABR3GHF4_9PEZI
MSVVIIPLLCLQPIPDTLRLLRSVPRCDQSLSELQVTAGAISPSTEIPEAPVQPVESKGRGRRHARHRGSRSERSRGQSHGVQLVPRTPSSPLGDQANVEAGRGLQEPDEGQSSAHDTSWAGLFLRGRVDGTTTEAAYRAPQQPDEGQSSSHDTSWAGLFLRGRVDVLQGRVDGTTTEAAHRAPQQPDEGQSSSHDTSWAGLFLRGRVDVLQGRVDGTTTEAAHRAPQQPDEGQSSSHDTSWAGLFAPPIISQQQQPMVQSQPPVSLPGQGQLEQGTDWMDQLARDMSELVVQPVTDPLQDRGLANPFTRGIPSPAVQRQGAERPPPHSVAARQEDQDWMNRLAYGMRELVLPAPPAPTAAVASRGRRGGLEPGYWGVESSNANTTAISTSAIPPTTPMNLNQLAEDASILLELFSQSPHDNNDIGDEDETMITSAAASIALIQARCSRRNRHTESREEINRDADCIICFAERADVVFLPCKHLVVCTVRTPHCSRNKLRHADE